jgi:hypothetical protein
MPILAQRSMNFPILLKFSEVTAFIKGPPLDLRVETLGINDSWVCDAVWQVIFHPLKINAICSFETSENSSPKIQRHIPESSRMPLYHPEN